MDKLITALGPNDPDDGEQGRQQRGLAIAVLEQNIRPDKFGYKVPSQSGNGVYLVNLEHGPYCTCPDFEKRQQPCKHVYAVQFTIERETQEDGSTTVTKTIQVTETSQWHIYNEAQTHEQERFTELLQALCEGISNPPYRTGRPRLALSDVVYSLASSSPSEERLTGKD